MTMLRRALILLGAAMAAACAVAPPERAPGPAFFPAPPLPPRIQHLKTFSGERDLGALRSGFAQLVLGDDDKSRALRQPYGAALFQGKLYVADTRAPGLAVFDISQQRYSLVTGSGSGRMKRPINVTIDANGTKYVTDTGRDQVLVYDRDDRFVTAFGERGQFKPVDTAIAGDRLYVVDIQHHEVQVLDKHSGKLLSRFGKVGAKPGELYHPTNIAVGPDGDIYVVETSNFRVQRFTAEGKSVRVYGELGTTLGSFARPKGIAVDRTGRLYVGDSAFDNVQVFDNAGRLLLFFGQQSEGPGALHLPAGIAIDYDNVELFRHYADPRFNIEYLILVASQFGPNKVDVFGFGRMSGMDYPADDKPAAKPTR